MRPVRVLRIGLQKYDVVLKLQEQLRESVKSELCPHTVVACQHPHVYTVGKRKTVHNILSPLSELHELGAEVVSVGRGGDVTYHGPGQVVLYPILNLRSLKMGARVFVENLEDVMINTAKRYHIDAYGRVPGQSGVWVEDRKLGAVGVQISSGISSHGMAFNVTTDLKFFDHIVPCGIHNKSVTSLKKELGDRYLNLEDVTKDLINEFCKVFDLGE